MKKPPDAVSASTVATETAEVTAVPYAWAALLKAKRSVRQLAEEMPKLREKVDKLLPVDRNWAKICSISGLSICAAT